MSVELFKVHKYPKTRKVLIFFFEVIAKPKVLENLNGHGKSHGKSWNLKC